MSIQLKDMVKEDSKEIVTVYHGTSAIYTEYIYLNGLKPRQGNKYVYVTTDKDAAEKYSKAWSAAVQTKYNEEDEFKEFSGFKNHSPDEGLILAIKIEKSKLEDDPYNPDGEPNQFRVPHKIPVSKIKKWDIKKFNFNESELLRNYAYWIGIARATDD